MDQDLQRIINECMNDYFKSDSDLPIGGEKKYLTQEPGGQMAAANLEETSFRIYNDKLCPLLWDEQQNLDPEVRSTLLQIAYDFYEKTGFQAPIVDVYLMGSISNYNWTTDSDIDVHVMIDYTQLGIPEKTIPDVVKTAGSQWNIEHDIIIKGHKVEMNLQNIREEKPHVTGIYSLVTGQWIRKPSYQNKKFDTMTIQTKYKEMKRYLEAAIRSGDREVMKDAKKYLDAFRQYGLDTGGELSVENIVFKIIRSKGLIKMLKNSIVSTYDKQMSVRENDQSIAKDYIGGIVQGEVRGEPVPAGRVKFYMHNDFPGLFSGQNHTNWRYHSKDNKIVWNLQPDQNDKRSVEDFLLKRGIKTPRHVNMYTYQHHIDEADADAIVVRRGEEVKEYYWHDLSTVLGPFLIFELEDGDQHFAYSFLQSNQIVYIDNDKKSLVTDCGNIKGTHYFVQKGISQIYPEFKEIPRRDMESLGIIVGRAWDINGIIHCTWWNREINMKYKNTLRQCIHKMSGVTNDKKIILHPDDYTIVSMYEWLKHGDREAISIDIGKGSSDSDKRRELHLLQAKEKQAALDVIGVKPKIPDTPDWKKQSLQGIAESLAKQMVSEYFGEGGKFYWMDSDCKLYQVPFEGHWDFAEKYLTQNKQYVKDYFERNNILLHRNAYTNMFNLGWVRIGIKQAEGEDVIEYNYNGDKGISSKQLKAVKDLGILHAVKYIRDDTKMSCAALQEINQKDISASPPSPQSIYKGDENLALMTLGNLKHLRDKCGRFYRTAKAREDSETIKWATEEYKKYNDEIKKRLAYINNPVNESFVHGFEVDYGRGEMYVEVFKNPTSSELKQCKPHYEIGALLSGKDIFVWNRERAYHKNVMTQLKMPDALSLLLIPDNTNINRMDILVTDATKGTSWHHNPKTAEFIRNHPFFKGKQIDSISYWDEDIVGDWEVLKEGYGMGDPTKDPKAVGRWTIKYDSSSKILDEIAPVPYDFSNPDEMRKYIEKAANDIINEDPLLNNPKTITKFLKGTMVEVTKASKFFVLSLLKKEYKEVGYYVKFIQESLKRLQPYLLHWARAGMERNKSNIDQIQRKAKEIDSAGIQSMNQIRSIYYNVKNFDNTINAIKEFRHLQELLQGLDVNMKELIDLCSKVAK